MKLKFFFSPTAVLTILLLALLQKGEAVNYTWTGATNAWATGSNWSPVGPPTGGDTAIFTSGGVNPSITTGESIDLIQFIATPHAYTFGVTGGTASLTFVSGGVNNSLLGVTALNQTFNITSGATVFFNTSSADINSTGKVTYNLDSSPMFFIPSGDAGKAAINLTNGAAVGFNFSSTANAATINAQLGSTVSVLNSSTLDSASVTLNASTLTYNSGVTTSNSSIAMSNGSTFTTSTLQVDRLSSATSTDQININGTYLAIGGSSVGDAIAGKISGPGIFDYFGTGDVTLTNTGNDYTGLTVVESGTIIATTDTLPTGGTVQTHATGTIEFNNSVSGSFTGPIVNSGTILYTGSATAILTGAISNDGNVVVNSPSLGTLTINNPSVLLSNAQVTSGSLVIPFLVCPNTTIDVNGSLYLSDGGGTGTQTFVNNGTIYYTGVNTATLKSPGSISGTGGLTVQAPLAGHLVLDCVNTYTGPTSVMDGILTVIENALPLAGAKTISSGATLEFNYNTGGTFAGNIVDNGTVKTSGSGDVILTGAITGTGNVDVGTLSPSSTYLRGLNDYSGGTHVASGASLVTTTQSLPATGNRVIDATGTILLDNSVIDVYTGTFQDDGLLQINTTADLTMSGAISGTGGVSVNSSGKKITFTGNNSYSGATTVIAGILDIIKPATGTQSGQINISFGAELDLEQAASTVGTYSGALNGAGLLTINKHGNTGRVALTGTSTFIGPAIVYAGELQATPANLPKTVAVNSNALVDLEQSSFSGTYDGVISDNGSGQHGALAINKHGGTGTVILTGANHYTGGTTVYNGILQGTTTSLKGNILVNSGTLVDFEQTAGTGKYSGVISGLGGVVINSIGGNSGTVEFSGKNTYSGGTLVSGGTLKGDTRSLQGVITDNATVEFDQHLEGIFNGSFAGNGVIEKSGFGKLILVNNSSAFTGTTNIRSGRLDLDTVLGGDVLVHLEGTLGGNGTVLNDLTVKGGGKVAPGHSVGTIAVGGDYHQESGGTYIAQFDRLGLSSLIDVQGSAVLDFGSELECDAKTNDPLINKTYTILTADAGLTGIFTVVKRNNILVDPIVTYDSNNAYVTLMIAPQNVAETYNQMQVATQMNTIPVNPSPELEEFLQQFAQESPEDARRTLSQMSGEPYTNVLLTAELANRQFVRRLFDPLRSILTENPCKPYVYCHYKPEFDLWASISGGRTFIHGNDNARGFRVSNYQLSGGIQSRFTKFLTAGAALSYERDTISYRIGGNARSNVVLGAIYGLYRPERFYLLGDFVFGYNNNHIKRTIVAGNLHYHPKSSPNVYQTSGYVELGTDYGFHTILVQPFLGFEAGHYRYSGFSETGGAPLALVVSSKSKTNCYTRLGLHLTSAPIGCGFNMGVDFAWRYRLTSNGNNIREYFQDFGNTFKVKGLPLQRNSFESVVYFVKELGRHWETYVEATGEGWNNSFSYSFVGGFKANW